MSSSIIPMAGGGGISVTFWDGRISIVRDAPGAPQKIRLISPHGREEDLTFNDHDAEFIRPWEDGRWRVFGFAPNGSRMGGELFHFGGHPA